MDVDRVRIRYPLFAVSAEMFAFAVGYGALLTMIWSDPIHPPLWVPLLWILGWLLALATRLTWGVTLTERGVTSGGLIFRRRVAWADVYAVLPESSFGGRYVRLWSRTGRTFRLRAPTAFLGIGARRYAADLALIAQWCESRAS